MERSFPINPVLRSMAYRNGELTIEFFKRSGNGVRIEKRQYGEVPQDIAYGLYYKKTAPEILSYYAKQIRKKFKLLSIKPTF
jgi:hypothetical protein